VAAQPWSHTEVFFLRLSEKSSKSKKKETEPIYVAVQATPPPWRDCTGIFLFILCRAGAVGALALQKFQFRWVCRAILKIVGWGDAKKPKPGWPPKTFPQEGIARSGGFCMFPPSLSIYKSNDLFSNNKQQQERSIQEGGGKNGDRERHFLFSNKLQALHYVAQAQARRREDEPEGKVENRGTKERL
jgi:hypothetical protein